MAANIGVRAPVFSAELVRGISDLELTMPDGVFLRRQLEVIGGPYSTLGRIHDKELVRVGKTLGRGAIRHYSSGFLAAYAILDGAVATRGDASLPARPLDVLEQYTDFMAREPRIQRAHFDQDYGPDVDGRHTEVVSLVNASQPMPRQLGLLLMFNFFGSWANPGREPRELPPRPAPMTQRPHRSATNQMQRRSGGRMGKG